MNQTHKERREGKETHTHKERREGKETNTQAW